MKRKWLIVLLFLTALGGAGYWCLERTRIDDRWIFEPVYAATFVIRCDTDTSLSPPSPHKPVDPSAMLALMHHDLKRMAVLHVITDLKLAGNFPRTADGDLTEEGERQYHRLMNRLRDAIHCKVVVDTDDVTTVAVTVVLNDSKLAADVAKGLGENYIGMVRERMNARLLEQKQFFEREVDRWRRELSGAESAKLRFVLNNKGITPDDPAKAHNKLNELKSQRDSTREALSDRRKRLADLIAWHAEQPEVIERLIPTGRPKLQALIEQLNDLTTLLAAEADDARSRVIALAVEQTLRRIAEAEQVIPELQDVPEHRVEEAPNLERIEAEKEIRRLTAEIETLTEALAEVLADVEKYEVINRNFFAVRNAYLQIERELAAAKTNLAYWDEQLRRVTAGFLERGTSISLLKRADPEPAPMTLAERRAWLDAKRKENADD